VVVSHEKVGLAIPRIPCGQSGFIEIIAGPVLSNLIFRGVEVVVFQRRSFATKVTS
jgi:hypothetical protein